MLMSIICAPRFTHAPGRQRQLFRIGPGDLHGNGLRVEVQIETVTGFGGLPQARVGRGHLGGRHTRTVMPTQTAERGIRDTGHGCEHEGAGQRVGAYYQWCEHGAIVSRRARPYRRALI